MFDRDISLCSIFGLNEDLRLLSVEMCYATNQPTCGKPFSQRKAI